MLENAMVLGAEREWNRINETDTSFDALSDFTIFEYMELNGEGLKALYREIGGDPDTMFDEQLVDILYTKMYVDYHDKLVVIMRRYIKDNGMENDVVNWVNEQNGMED